jgi:anti-sigma B factor antagonist
MTQQLTVDVRHDDPFTVITVGGEIDIDTAPALREVVTEVTDAGADRLVFDLSDVGFVDSTRRVVAIFKIAGLDELFAVRPTLAAVFAGADPAEPA